MADAKAQLRKILRQFNLQELHDIVMVEFPELDWKQIQLRIVENHHPLSKRNAIDALINIIEEKQIVNEKIEDRAMTLKLIGLGKSTKAKWAALELQDKQEIPYPDAQDLCERIQNAYLKDSLRVTAYSVNWENRTIACVIERKIIKGRGVRLAAPLYFQYYPNTPYSFYRRPLAPKRLLKPIVNSLGYNECTECNLFGRHVPDLFRLLRGKEWGAVDAASLIAAPTFEPSYVGSNFNQGEARREYATQLCGDEKAPAIENITVTMQNCDWEGLPENFNCCPLGNISLTFAASNAFGLVKELIDDRVIQLPAPPYIKAITQSASNNVVKQFSKF